MFQEIINYNRCHFVNKLIVGSARLLGKIFYQNTRFDNLIKIFDKRFLYIFVYSFAVDLYLFIISNVTQYGIFFHQFLFIFFNLMRDFYVHVTQTP